MVRLMLLVFVTIFPGYLQASVSKVSYEGIEARFIDYVDGMDEAGSKVIFFHDSATLFDSDYRIYAQNFMRAGLHPVRAVIHNNSKEPIKISAKSVDAWHATADEAMALLFPATLGKSPSTYLLVCTFSALLANIYERNNFLQGKGSFEASLSYLGLGIVLGFIVSYVAKKSMIKLLLEQHLLYKEVTIPPGGKVQKLILFAADVMAPSLADISSLLFPVTKNFLFSIFDVTGVPRAYFSVINT